MSSVVTADSTHQRMTTLLMRRWDGRPTASQKAGAADKGLVRYFFEGSPPFGVLVVAFDSTLQLPWPPALGLGTPQVGTPSLGRMKYCSATYATMISAIVKNDSMKDLRLLSVMSLPHHLQ